MHQQSALEFLPLKLELPSEYTGETRALFLYHESFAALRACVKLEPSWLEEEIHRVPKGHPHVQDLAYLLANLPSAADIWRRRSHRSPELICCAR